MGDPLYVREPPIFSRLGIVLREISLRILPGHDQVIELVLTATKAIGLLKVQDRQPDLSIVLGRGRQQTVDGGARYVALGHDQRLVQAHERQVMVVHRLRRLADAQEKRVIADTCRQLKLRHVDQQLLMIALTGPIEQRDLGFDREVLGNQLLGRDQGLGPVIRTGCLKAQGMDLVAIRQRGEELQRRLVVTAANQNLGFFNRHGLVVMAWELASSKRSSPRSDPRAVRNRDRPVRAERAYDVAIRALATEAMLPIVAPRSV